MLNVDDSLQIQGLTLFRDYSDSAKFYYLPDSPQLAREGGEPLFQLLIYRRDVTDNPDFNEGEERGGGFLTMTVDLKVSDEKLEAVRGELRRRARVSQVELTPVPIEQGSVRVTALGVSAGGSGGTSAVDAEQQTGSTRFVENILGYAQPSMYGDNRAVFSIELSTEGALLMKASLEDNGASSISVLYDLDYKGLMPARECKIVIEFRQSYEHFRARAQANTLWFKADIDRETEALIKNTSIKIEDVDYMGGLTPEQLTARATELNRFARELAQGEFFRPGLRPGEVLAKDRGEITVYDPTEAAAQVTAGFSTPLELALTGQGRGGEGQQVVRGHSDQTGGIGGHPVTPPAAPGAGAPAGTAGGTAAGTQGAGAGTQGAAGAGAATTPAAPANRPMTAVERWNAAGRPQAAFMLRSLSQSEQQRIEYNLRQVTAVTRSIAPQGSIKLAAGDAQLRGRIKFVDLDDDFFSFLKVTVTTNADLADLGVNSLVVKVRYGVHPDGRAPFKTDEFLLKAKGEEKSTTFPMDHRRTMDFEYQVVVNYNPDFGIGHDVTQMTSPWIRTSTRNLDIDPRSVQGLLMVRLLKGQIDFDVVRSVQAQVIYEDEKNGIHAEQTVQIDRDSPDAVVPIRLANPELTSFRVVSKWFTAGSVDDLSLVKTRGNDVVLNQPPSKAVPVSLQAVDPLDRYDRMTVELAYAPGGGQPEQRSRVFTLTGENPSASWTFFLPSLEAEPRYRYAVTLIGKDGTVRKQDWTPAVERQLIVGDVFPGMLDVEVELVDDPTAAGFRLALFTLTYPDVPEGMDGTEQVRFRTAQVARVRMPSTKLPVGTYSWKMEYLGAGGKKVVEEGSGSEETLVLFAPVE
jgi:hypothetical protein